MVREVRDLQVVGQADRVGEVIPEDLQVAVERQDTLFLASVSLMSKNIDCFESKKLICKRKE